VRWRYLGYVNIIFFSARVMSLMACVVGVVRIWRELGKA